MQTISREELKDKLDRGDDFKLICVLGDWAFQAQHIPGSIHIPDESTSKRLLELEDEIIVYCTNESCQASVFAYEKLIKAGYKDVRRYSGGLADWFEAGYPLEGEITSMESIP